jgi:site-specific DNA-cytosine methylase
MRYLSLFSGIGCFEHAIHAMYPDAICLGYSEIKPEALRVYQHHYPTHRNLGDVTTITESTIRDILGDGGCDLIVGGFPCKDLSSFSWLTRKSKGLEGERSGLFFTLLQILRWVYQYNSKSPLVLIENNFSMKRENREVITHMLEQFDPEFRCYPVDRTLLGSLQRRRRLFWVNRVSQLHFSASDRKQVWNDVLVPSHEVVHLLVSSKHIKRYNKTYCKGDKHNLPLQVVGCSPQRYRYTRDPEKMGTRSLWQENTHSDTALPHAYVITEACNFLIVRDTTQPECFQVRSYHPVELERLFHLPDGYVSDLCSRTQCARLLGNAVIVSVVRYLLEFFGEETA